MRRVGVEHRAHPLGRLVDLAVVVVLLAALEDEVLEEVGHAVLLRALGAGAGLEGDEHGDRPRARQVDPVQREPVGQGGGVDLRHAWSSVAARNSGCRQGSQAGGEYPPGRPMAATERHIRRRTEPATPRQRVVGDPVPGAVIDFRSVSKKYPSGDMGLRGRDVRRSTRASSSSWSARPARASRRSCAC